MENKFSTMLQRQLDGERRVFAVVLGKKNNFGTVYDIPKSTQNTSQIVVLQSLEMRQCECESSNFVFFKLFHFHKSCVFPYEF